MTSEQETALQQAEGALGALNQTERHDAKELISLGRKLFPNEAVPSAEDRTRLLRLIELLARRSATAMPYAALGRALSAHLAGDFSLSKQLLQEFQTKLQMLGL